MPDRINLGALHARRLLFFTREAAAILYEVCSRLNNAEEEGQPLEVPTLDRLWIEHDGELTIEAAPAAAGTDPMPALALLIERVLPPSLRGQPDYAVPSSFRVLAPRARRFPPGLPPLDAPGDLAAAINRYRDGKSSKALLQSLYARAARVTEDSPFSIESESSPASPPPAGTGAHDDHGEDTRHEVRPLESPALVWPPPADSVDDLWVIDAPDAHEWEPEPREPADLPLHSGAMLPPRSGAAFGPARYARRWLLAAAAMLLAFGIGYEVTRHVITSSDGVSRENEPRAATSVASGPSTPHVRTQDGARMTHARDTRVPRSSNVEDILAAPIEIPASTGPVFSPSFASGSSLLFHAGRNPAARLMSANLRGGDGPLDVVTIIAGGARNYHPRLSPDGRSLAFDSDRDGVRGIYIANRDGSDLHRVSGVGFAAVPAWSPDMRWLAFVRGEPGHQQVWNLWLHDLSTGTDRPLTRYRYGEVWTGSWFPDSRRLCYSHEDRLVIVDIDSGQTRTFASPRAGKLVRTPAVSPDGRRIAFQVLHDGVWLLDLSSGAMARIIDDPSAEEFAWAPDGGHLAYHSRRSGAWRIWLATIPGGMVIGP